MAEPHTACSWRADRTALPKAPHLHPHHCQHETGAARCSGAAHEAYVCMFLALYLPCAGQRRPVRWPDRPPGLQLAPRSRLCAQGGPADRAGRAQAVRPPGVLACLAVLLNSWPAAAAGTRRSNRRAGAPPVQQSRAVPRARADRHATRNSGSKACVLRRVHSVPPPTPCCWGGPSSSASGTPATGRSSGWQLGALVIAAMRSSSAHNRRLVSDLSPQDLRCDLCFESAAHLHQ